MNMSSPQADLSEQPPHRRMQSGYTPTEEEKRVLRECNSESFWYRSVPFSVVSMLATQTLIRRGILTTSTRFGSFPKIAVAGVFGYIAGKISYIKECREKFLRLENSPMAEIIRQGPKTQAQFPKHTDNAETAAPQQTFAPVEAKPTSSVYNSKYETKAVEVPFSSSMSESSPTGIGDNVLKEPEPILEETSKQKPLTYDELRDQNRDSYHKAGLASSRAPMQEKKPWKEVKKNKYGDVWEE
ncbi:OCIA domain-containing protein 1 [Bufo gargarizans]|uniref:OCIA domain-containing protein 1 n=1 Tax=Bufo gargarizans TaxID=30331 RepID=UPI001CF2E6BD|nr:OCIA domain-containing protein 1 [Bufo gargarizans]